MQRKQHLLLLELEEAKYTHLMIAAQWSPNAAVLGTGTHHQQVALHWNMFLHAPRPPAGDMNLERGSPGSVHLLPSLHHLHATAKLLTYPHNPRRIWIVTARISCKLGTVEMRSNQDHPHLPLGEKRRQALTRPGSGPNPRVCSGPSHATPTHVRQGVKAQLGPVALQEMQAWHTDIKAWYHAVTTTRFARSEKACCPQVQRHHSKACTADASVRECCCWLTRSPAFSQQRSLAWRMAPVPTGFPDPRGAVLPARLIPNPRVASCSHSAGPATRSVRRIRCPHNPALGLGATCAHALTVRGPSRRGMLPLCEIEIKCLRLKLVFLFIYSFLYILSPYHFIYCYGKRVDKILLSLIRFIENISNICISK
jgi:hypothetical protein